MTKVKPKRRHIKVIVSDEHGRTEYTCTTGTLKLDGTKSSGPSDEQIALVHQVIASLLGSR